MLIPGTKLLNSPVMSLQTGTMVAETDRAIIDPRKLQVVAYELSGPLLDKHPSLLRTEDIRELADVGMIVDSSDELVSPDDIIKLKEIYELNFPLIGIQVVDDKKHKLGKVIGYTMELGNFVIQQINVKRPIMKSLGDTELLIHRSQIVSMTPSTITVKAGKVNSEPVKVATRTYVNPFRQSQGAQPESTETIPS
jgi:uncharacterized protein YrrD